MKGGVYFHIHTTASQAYGIISHLLAYTGAQTAQDTIIIFFFKAWLFEAIVFCQFFDDRHIRAPGK
jgi:hypothetical protein